MLEEDPLKISLLNNEEVSDKEADDYKQLLDKAPSLMDNEFSFKTLEVQAKEERSKTPPKVELKRLPSHL